MDIIYSLYIWFSILIYAVFAVGCYRLGVKDGTAQRTSEKTEGNRYSEACKEADKKATTEKVLSSENKKTLEGITNILSYGIGGER